MNSRKASSLVSLVCVLTSCAASLGTGWLLLEGWRFCVDNCVTRLPWYGLLLLAGCGAAAMLVRAPGVLSRLGASRRAALPASILLVAIVVGWTGYVGVREANWVEYQDPANFDWPYWRVNRVTREYDDLSSPPTRIEMSFAAYDRAHRQYRLR